MQTRYSDENSVRPSVHPSHAWFVTKRKKRPVQIFIPYEGTFILVFWEDEWLVGATPSTWNFGLTGLRWIEIADFPSIFARSASAVTPGEKVQLTLIGSPLGQAQDEYRTLSLSPRTIVSKVWTISCDNSETISDRISYYYSLEVAYVLSFDTDLDDLEWPRMA